VPLRAIVSASSANLGPGFDCLGLAVRLELVVRARRADRDAFRYAGDGEVEARDDNLIHRGFRAAYRAGAGRPAPAVALEADNPIPLARGLGSSSAALVAGALLGDAAAGGPLGRDGVFQLTADLEGHPDNVAPALFGGLTVSAHGEGGWRTEVLPWPAGWRLLFGVPAFEVRTEAARAALPDRLPRETAVRTAARAALWPVAVLRERPELLRLAADDVAHEPFRRALLPGFEEAQAALRAAGAWAAYLSGAGPTLGVVCSDERLAACHAILARYAGPQGRVLAAEPGAPARVSGRFAAAPAAP
jgi:homoserine kinase